MDNRNCKDCKYHSDWYDMGLSGGFVCNHPQEITKSGLMYGHFFSVLRTRPRWCPLNKIEEENNDER